MKIITNALAPSQPNRSSQAGEVSEAQRDTEFSQEDAPAAISSAWQPMRAGKRSVEKYENGGRRFL